MNPHKRLSAPAPQRKAPLIAASILSADLQNLAADTRRAERGGTDWFHIDVMDGVFVPPITFGDNVVRSMRKLTKRFLDVHLMVREPERHLELFAKAGSDRIIVHQETCPHLHRTLNAIRALGVKNGVAINPSTPVETVLPVLDICDSVLIMSVNPGWGGQSFLPLAVKKIEVLRGVIDDLDLPTMLEVDGGIDQKTGRLCFEAGVDVLVSGSYLFGHKDLRRRVDILRGKTR